MRWRIRNACWIVLPLLLTAGPGIAALPDSISLNGVTVESSLTAIILQPNESLEISYQSRNLEDRLQVNAEQGALVAVGTETWLYQPPTARWRSVVDLASPHRKLRIKVFQAEPLPAGARRLNGYPLGAYPTGSDRPRGLLKLERAQADERVSPNLRLGDFVSQQPLRWPRYLLFSTALLEQLELVPKVLADSGFPEAQLKILSTYRTPDHNRAVGGAARSRHIYGDAADLIVDSDNDGRMDDLNQDGSTSRADVEWLIARLQRAGVPVAIGGVGSYETTGPAGAFLHIDARGRAADWVQ